MVISKFLCFCAVVCLGLNLACAPAHNRIVIGSKNFTEQAVLGEMIAQYLEGRGYPVERRFYLAGTYICHQALLAGRIDIYVEYTGTALAAILKEPLTSLLPSTAGHQEVYERVKAEYGSKFHAAVEPPLGFNNTFALVIRGEDARRLRLQSVSDAVPYSAHWRAGFGYEFMERPDGYAGLAKTYGLRFADTPRVMDLGLLYRALQTGQVDVVAGSATDGLIPALNLRVLADDRHYFPPYDAVPVVRQSALQRWPGLQAALGNLNGKISDEDMRSMNYAVDAQHQDAVEVVREFLHRKGLRSDSLQFAASSPEGEL